MATVLAFHLRADALKKLRIQCASMKITLKVIDEPYYGCRLGELVSGDCTPCEDPEAAFSEPMLVLASFSQTQFNAFLQGMKRFGVPRIALKAVLTPYNAEWTAAKLYGELNAEREAVQSGKTAHDNG